MTRTPSRRALRATRSAISPRLATRSVRIGPVVAAWSGAPSATAESDERDTRTREPTRVAGSRPSAIQRCTVRTVTPSRSATSRGVRSSGMSRLSQAPQVGGTWSVGRTTASAPAGWPLPQERPQPFLALGRRPLLGDVADRVSAGLLRAERTQLAHQRLGRASGRRTRRAQLTEQLVDADVERTLIGHHLMNEPDPDRPFHVESLSAGEQGPRVRLADLGEHERADDGRDDAKLRLGEPEGRIGGGQHDVR